MIKKVITNPYFLGILGWSIVARLFFWDPIIRPLSNGHARYSESSEQSKRRGFFISDYTFRFSNNFDSIKIMKVWSEAYYCQSGIFSFNFKKGDNRYVNIIFELDKPKLLTYNPVFYFRHIDLDFDKSGSGGGYNDYVNRNIIGEKVIFKTDSLKLDTLKFLVYNRSSIQWDRFHDSLVDYPPNPRAFKLPPLDTLTLIRLKK
jgi:hypothetical protein